MTHVDGNALAGTFAELFSLEVTNAVGQCGSCGRSAELARAQVFLSAMGAVMHCSTCDAVLAVIVQTEEAIVLNLSGLASMTIAKPGRSDSVTHP